MCAFSSPGRSISPRSSFSSSASGLSPSRVRKGIGVCNWLCAQRADSILKAKVWFGLGFVNNFQLSTEFLTNTEGFGL